MLTATYAFPELVQLNVRNLAIDFGLEQVEMLWINKDEFMVRAIDPKTTIIAECTKKFGPCNDQHLFDETHSHLWFFTFGMLRVTQFMVNGKPNTCLTFTNF